MTGSNQTTTGAIAGSRRDTAIGHPALVAFLLLAALLTGFTRPAFAGDDACLACHGERDLVRQTEYRQGTSVFVDPAAIAASVHAGLGCADCHPDAGEGHPEQLTPAACASCHEDVAQAYSGGEHAAALARGDADAPACGDCHGGHRILAVADTASTVHPQRVPRTCAACHADPGFIERRATAMTSPLEGYERSIHFKALTEGRHGATCTDCHESHGLRRPTDPRSTIYPTRVPATCGQCHLRIQAEYEKSIHGQALVRGERHAPTCVDCHGEHEIRSLGDPLSRVYPTAIVNSTCVQCHASIRIASRYGMRTDRLESYRDSYHGLALKDGSLVTAHCASCHGVHNILPPADPASTVNPGNLQQTCGNCHPGAGQRFTQIPVHSGAGTSGNGHWLNSLVRRSYLWLIAGLLGLMLAHNGVILGRTLIDKYRRRRTSITYERLNSFQVIQHAVLVSSFTVLVVTGFALKFSDAWWVAPLSAIGMTEQVRHVTHRIAAVVLLTQSVVYTLYLLLARQGRRDLRDLLPRLRDLRDLRQNLWHHLGRPTPRPAYDRFNYVEKMEFWAVVWGVVVMGFTGLVLWFPETAIRLLPAWAFGLAEIVHYYEAWLATLAIVVWHFFYVIFYPGEYPLNLTCLDGRVTEEEMEAHHPLELERRRREGDTGSVLED